MSQAGPELLRELLDRHAAALVLYARTWCDCAEDVVQEAFVQLVRQPQIPENAAGWLYRVVRNGAISAMRSAKRRRRHEAAAAGQRPLFSASPHSDLEAEAVAAALEGLPEEQREIVVAHLWGGLTFAELGRLTETSASTVHRRYEAGLAALRERLGAPCTTNRPENRSNHNSAVSKPHCEA